MPGRLSAALTVEPLEMDYILSLHHLPILLSQFSILPAAVIGMIRFKKISSIYYPFVYFCWAGLLAEVLSVASVALFHNNAVSANIYVLLEFLLIVWQFKNWGLFQGVMQYYRLLLAAMPVLWLLDGVILHPITRFSSVYRMSYSLAVVLFSAYYMNTLFFSERRSILRNPRFLISLAFLVYFTFKGLFEIYFLFHIKHMKTLYHYTMLGLDAVNMLANFTFILVMLWIPKKDTFSMR